jgi:hypothetical protein
MLVSAEQQVCDVVTDRRDLTLRVIASRMLVLPRGVQLGVFRDRRRVLAR